MFVLIIPVVNGNGFRALVIGVVVLTVGLYIATNLSPLITTAALNAQYIKQGSGAISSICDGANPLTWVLVRVYEMGPVVGLGVPAAVAVVMAVFNRKKILREAAEMRAAASLVEAE
jgi:PTS system galactitol-specific IIC component